MQNNGHNRKNNTQPCHKRELKMKLPIGNKNPPNFWQMSTDNRKEHF